MGAAWGCLHIQKLWGFNNKATRTRWELMLVAQAACGSLLCQQRLKEWTWKHSTIKQYNHAYTYIYSNMQLSKYYAKKIIKHKFLDNLTDIQQRNKVKSHATISWVALWGIWVVLLQLCLLWRFLVLMSHAALCQLWLCNTDICVIDFSFWLTISKFMHLFFLRNMSKLYDFISSTLSTYMLLRSFEIVCFVILSSVVVWNPSNMCVLCVHSLLFFQQCGGPLIKHNSDSKWLRSKCLIDTLIFITVFDILVSCNQFKTAQNYKHTEYFIEAQLKQYSNHSFTPFQGLVQEHKGKKESRFCKL